MSTPATKRRANQPVIPSVSVATWKSLLAVADDFNRLAPWDWMHDSHLVGLQDPVTKEVLLGSILGRQRTLFALVVYRRDSGHRWLLNTIMNEGDSGGLDDVDSAFEQDALKVEFVLKRELGKEDRSALAAADYSPASKNGRIWPMFRSLLPGGYPWHVTQAEADILLFALPRAAAFARLLREHPEVCVGHLDGEIGHLPPDFDPAGCELRPEDLDWQPMIPPPDPLPDLVSFDVSTGARLMELTQAKGFHLEVDLVYSNIVVADVERPRFPKLAMAVDSASGFIGGFRLSEFKDNAGADALGMVFRNALHQMGHRPETIRVQRPRVAAMLSKAANELGIPILREAELPALNFARDEMQSRFSR